MHMYITQKKVVQKTISNVSLNMRFSPNAVRFISK